MTTSKHLGIDGKPSARQATAMKLIRTADGLRKYFADFYEPYGITPQQYNVLRILRGAESEGLPTMEIANRMIEKTPGITRLLDRLEEKGLVERRRDPDDRRQVVISISAAGLELLRNLDEPVREATESALSMLDRHEVDQLNVLLKRINEPC